MPVTNVKTQWTSGNLEFVDSSGNVIAKIDADNRMLDVPSGTSLGLAGTAVTKTAAQVNAMVVGVGGGYKIARGEVTLDGSNPTIAQTGLTAVVMAAATLKGNTAPGDDPNQLTVNWGGALGANVEIYAWKHTSNVVGTMIASTNNTANVAWMAIGT